MSLLPVCGGICLFCLVADGVDFAACEDCNVVPFLAPQTGLQVSLASAELLLLRVRNCCFPPTSHPPLPIESHGQSSVATSLIPAEMWACGTFVWEEMLAHGAFEEQPRAEQTKQQRFHNLAISPLIISSTVHSGQSKRKGRHGGQSSSCPLPPTHCAALVEDI